MRNAIKIAGIAVFISLIVGCASKPPVRPSYTEAVPTLEKGWVRLNFFAGNYVEDGQRLFPLSKVHHVGPVYINNEEVGRIAENEYVMVDLKPGTYEMSCSPQEPDKNFAVKTQVTVSQGTQRAYACDMSTFSASQAAKLNKAAGFGLIGMIAYNITTDYSFKTYLVESPLPTSSRLVSYHKFLGKVGVSNQSEK